MTAFKPTTRPSENLEFVTPNPVTGYTPAAGDAVGIEIATGKHQKYSAAGTAGAPTEIFYGVIQKVDTENNCLKIQRGGDILYSSIKHSVTEGAKETVFKYKTLFENRFNIQ